MLPVQLCPETVVDLLRRFVIIISARLHSRTGVFDGVPEIVMCACDIGNIIFHLNIGN
jgi:hypothetical protein